MFLVGRASEVPGADALVKDTRDARVAGMGGYVLRDGMDGIGGDVGTIGRICAGVLGF